LLDFGLAKLAVEPRAASEAPTAAGEWVTGAGLALGTVGSRGLGELDEGVQWWAKSVEERDPVIVTSLKTEPGYDPMRSHPAFHALLRKMNLPKLLMGAN